MLLPAFIAISTQSTSSKAHIVKHAPDRYEEAARLVKVVDEIEVEGVHREHLLQRVEYPTPPGSGPSARRTQVDILTNFTHHTPPTFPRRYRRQLAIRRRRTE